MEQAQAAMDEAAEPVIRELGHDAIRCAEDAVGDFEHEIVQVQNDADESAQALSESVDQEADAFVCDHDMTKRFMEEMEAAKEPDVETTFWSGAARDAAARYEAAKGGTLPSYDIFSSLSKGITAEEQVKLMNASDDMIRDLTRRKDK